MKEPKRELFNEIWAYYKKWINNDGSDVQWEEILAEGNAIIVKHKQDPFARSLVGIVQAELGRI